MAAPSTNRHLDLPRIDVDISPDHEADAISSTPTPTSYTGRGRSTRNLMTPDTAGQDRSYSGSTSVSSNLAVPTTPGGASSATSIFSLDEREDALRPDPGSEADFTVPDNKFAFSPGQLGKMLNPKSLAAYVALSGLHGIERGLRSDIDAGLSVDEAHLDGTVTFSEAMHCYKELRELDGTATPRDVRTRQHIVGATGSDGTFVDRKRVDKILILLTVAAMISLALGLYETLGADHPPGSPPPVDWIEGLAICIAIIIVVLVGSLHDYQKERAFVKLNAKKHDRQVKVIRFGKSFMINVYEILVGDVLHLEHGDMVPADGIFISGHNFKCDESSATGESDALNKVGGEQVLRLLEQGHHDLHDMDPFIISGSKVLEGVGTYMVTSIGVNSGFGKILMAMRTEIEPTPLQVKLNGLATTISKLGSSAALLLFVVLLIRFLAGLSGNSDTPSAKASAFLDIY
ncbi:plasma membrane calcium [Elasticomyces elasticus]|nr:plasma membrane calcium [Elasticomyces elasticus]